MLANLPSRTINGPVIFTYFNFLISSAFSAPCSISSWCPQSIPLRTIHSEAYGGSIIAGKILKPLRRDGNSPCTNSVATLVPVLTLVVLCVNRRLKRRHFYMYKLGLMAIKLWF